MGKSWRFSARNLLRLGMEDSQSVEHMAAMEACQSPRRLPRMEDLAGSQSAEHMAACQSPGRLPLMEDMAGSQSVAHMAALEECQSAWRRLPMEVGHMEASQPALCFDDGQSLPLHLGSSASTHFNCLLTQKFTLLA